MVYEIWSDNALEAEWFADLSELLSEAPRKIIQGRGLNPTIIDELVTYDRPDIILLRNSKPILVLEKTREVPTGHNVGQRVARLVRSAEYSVPTIFFLPFDARKHGKYSSVCSLNARLIRAMFAMAKIHNCPVLPVSWPCDEEGQLIVDGRENEKLKALVNAIIQPTSDPNQVKNYEQELRLDLERREKAFPNYKKLPASATIIATSTLGIDFGNSSGGSRIMSREESLVYVMDMSEAKCKRQDPYTGMQFIYDYGWLRNGKSPINRNKNLILHVPNVTKKTWLEKNPNDITTKSCNWYLTADAILLKDGVIVLDEWPLHHE